MPDATMVLFHCSLDGWTPEQMKPMANGRGFELWRMVPSTKAVHYCFTLGTDVRAGWQAATPTHGSHTLVDASAELVAAVAAQGHSQLQLPTKVNALLPVAASCAKAVVSTPLAASTSTKEALGHEVAASTSHGVATGLAATGDTHVRPRTMVPPPAAPEEVQPPAPTEEPFDKRKSVWAAFQVLPN